MSNLKEQVQELLNSDNESVEIEMTPIQDIQSILNEFGYEDLDLDGEETNGWQIDFWYKFYKKDSPTLMVSGSLHYGDFKISKYEKQEDE